MKKASDTMVRPEINKYYVYIVTDKDKRELQTGVTGSLKFRLDELGGSMEIQDTDCKYFLYWEDYDDALQAIIREKELKKLSKKKKQKLVNESNPEWRFLNEEVVRQVAY